MTRKIIPYDGKNLQFNIVDGDAWLTQKDLAELYDLDVRTISEHISNIFDEEELDNSTIRRFRILADDGKQRKVNHYNLDMAIALGYRVSSKKGTQFRKWASSVLLKFIREGVAVNPKLASTNPEAVQDSFYEQMTDSMRHHLNKHAHTPEYTKERIDNINVRKALNSELSRTVDGTPNYGKIAGLFHVTLTGKTKSKILADYEHATTQTRAIDALGSIVVNQMNQLMYAVKASLQNYPDDYIPDDQHIAEIQRLMDKFGKPLRQYLENLAEETGQPLHQLGTNTRKRKLL